MAWTARTPPGWCGSTDAVPPPLPAPARMALADLWVGAPLGDPLGDAGPGAGAARLPHGLLFRLPDPDPARPADGAARAGAHVAGRVTGDPRRRASGRGRRGRPRASHWRPAPAWRG